MLRDGLVEEGGEGDGGVRGPILEGDRGDRGYWGGWVRGFGGGNRGFGAAGAEGAGHGYLFWFEWGDARVRT